MCKWILNDSEASTVSSVEAHHTKKVLQRIVCFIAGLEIKYHFYLKRTYYTQIRQMNEPFKDTTFNNEADKEEIYTY